MEGQWDLCDAHEFDSINDCPYCRIEELKKELADVNLSLEAHKEIIKAYYRDSERLESKLAKQATTIIDQLETNEMLKSKLARYDDLIEEFVTSKGVYGYTKYSDIGWWVKRFIALREGKDA